MRLLIFDTETNGLPKSMYVPFYDTDNWPRVLQIAWQVLEVGGSTDATNCVERASYCIQPAKDMEWDATAASIHGLSRDELERDGTPLAEVLAAFQRVASSCHALVAHNIAFDYPVIMAEYVREKQMDMLSWIPHILYCTCDETRSLCKLPTQYASPRNPYKRPKLSELHTYLFGHAGEYAAHSAAGDVACLTACVQELVRRRVLPLADWRDRLGFRHE